MHRFHRSFTAAVSILAGLVWSWLDTRTYLGPESAWATRWRIAAFAIMVAAAFWGWSRSTGGRNAGTRTRDGLEYSHKGNNMRS